MKKRLIAIISVSAIICSLGVTQALAMGPRGEIPNTIAEGMERLSRGERPERPEGLPEKRDGTYDGKHSTMTDEQKAHMEAVHTAHTENLNAFLQSLTDAQKALYEAMKPQVAKPDEGQRPEKPDEASMKAAMQQMKENQEAFIASLSEAQKTLYDELFGKHDGFGFGNMERPHGKHNSE